MPTSIELRHAASDVDSGALRQALDTAIVTALGQDAEVSVLLCDDAAIAELNQQYLGHAGPTDVISFPQHLLAPGETPPDGLLGDIAISVDTAARQAAGFDGWELADELTLLGIHGLLHLCGYDDQIPAERKVMQEAEDKLLQAAGRPKAPRDET
jgi:probable rRNA maturation factor